jgi:hypothetical protein
VGQVLEDGMVELLESKYSSPVFFTPKSTGGYWAVVDNDYLIKGSKSVGNVT